MRHLLFTLRSLSNHKTYNLINLVGLIVGIACSLMIYLQVTTETGIDVNTPINSFRLIIKQETESMNRKVALTSEEDATHLEDNFAEVEEVLTLRPYYDSRVLKNGDHFIQSNLVVFTEPEIIDFFPLQVIQGNPNTFLSEPSSVVLTRRVANILFPDEDPMGKTVDLQFSIDFPLKVTGIIEESENSHLQYDVLVSWNSTLPNGRRISESFSRSLYTYVKLAENANVENLEKNFNRTIKERNPEEYAGIDYLFQPVKDIYFGSADVEFDEAFKSGSWFNVYLLQAIALFILLLAVINYANISIARSLRQGKDVGIRKVLGAGSGSIFRKYIGETAFMVGTATLVAYLLVVLMLPAYESLIGKEIDDSLIFSSKIIISLFLGIGVLSLLAGFYPSIILSRYSPVRAIKSHHASFSRTPALRLSLVGFQFLIAIVLIAGSLGVYQQAKYLREKPLGFDEEQVLVLPLTQTKNARTSYRAFMSELERDPHILETSISTDVIGSGATNNSGVLYAEGNPEKEALTTIFGVDDEFFDVYGIKVIEGRNFDLQRSSDSSAFIINEKMAEVLGMSEPLEGRIKYREEWPGIPIIGVVENFHFQGFRQEIRPVVFRIPRGNLWNVSVRFRSGEAESTLAHIEGVWGRFEKDTPFQYSFVDQQFAQFYQADLRLLTIIIIFAGLSVFIALLGLFGITNYSIQQRVKEIGIRKVLGANLKDILTLVNRSYLIIVGLASVIAAPVIMYLLNSWYNDFIYHTDFSIFTIAVAAGLAVLLCGLLVTGVSYRAATQNPAHVLQDD